MNFTENGCLKLDGSSFLLSWRLRLEEEGGDSFFLEPVPEMECSWQKAGKGYIARWKGGMEKRFFAEIYWEKRGSRYDGRFQYGGLSGKYRVRKLFFPLLFLPAELKNAEIFLPEGMGKKEKIPSEDAFFCREDESPLLPFVYVKCEGKEKKGCYLGAFPPKGSFLGTFWHCNGRIRELALTHPLSLSPTSRKKYLLPYDCSYVPLAGEEEPLAPFRQLWEESLLCRKRRKYKKSPCDLLWIWKKGGALPDAEKILLLLREKGYSCGILTKTDLPEEEKIFFRKNDLPLIAMENGMHWTNWEGYSAEEKERSFIQTEKGEKTPGAFVCLAPETAGYKRVKNEARALAQKEEYCGIFYKDLLSEEGRTLCFSPEHLHIPGGGSYRKEALLRLLTRLHKENPRLIFLAEGASWETAGVLDGMLLPPLEEGEGEEFIKLFASIIPLYMELAPERGGGAAEKGCRLFFGGKLSLPEYQKLLQKLPPKEK